MSLTKKDEIRVQEIVIDAMTTVMMPVLDRIMDKQAEHSDKLEDIEDIKLTVNRIETLQRSELGRVDNHEIRIVKLEKAKI